MLYCILLGIASFILLLIYQTYYCREYISIRQAAMPALKINKKKVIAFIFYMIMTVVFYIFMDLNGSILMKTFKYMCMLYILLVIAWIDSRVQKIPNMLLLIMIILRFIFFIFESLDMPEFMRYNILDMFSGSLFCLVLLVVCRIIVKNSIGMGDIKLFTVLGMYFGFDVLRVMLFSFFCTAVYSIGLMIFKKKTRHDSVPMGPFVFIGTVITIVLT